MSTRRTPGRGPRNSCVIPDRARRTVSHTRRLAEVQLQDQPRAVRSAYRSVILPTILRLAVTASVTRVGTSIIRPVWEASALGPADYSGSPGTNRATLPRRSGSPP